jgi:hypothetical protein
MESTLVNQHLIGKSYSEIVDHLQFDEDCGGCCGYASIEEISEIPKGIDKNKLTLKNCVEISYGGEYNERVVLNFIFTDGEGELILGYELTASSGSGWSYGAYAKIMHENQLLAGVSW